MANPRRSGPARSIFMITVVDQHRPWLIPRRIFARTTQPHDGAKKINAGSGSAKSQPATSTFFRPQRSPIRPAKRLAIALTRPKLAIKERIAARDARPNSRSASKGKITRSIPTVAPTKALMRTKRENCSQLARRPRRIRPVRTGTRSRLPLGDCTTVGPSLQLGEIDRWRAASFVQIDDLQVVRRRGGQSRQQARDESIFGSEPTAELCEHISEGRR